MAVDGPGACFAYLDGRVEAAQAARLEEVVDGVVGPALLLRRRRAPVAPPAAAHADGLHAAADVSGEAPAHPRPPAFPPERWKNRGDGYQVKL